MRKILLIISAVLFTLNVFSQAPDWDWARQANGGFLQTCSSVATDASGNVYSSGNYGNGSITFGSVTLPAYGSKMFLVKYDTSGNVIWAINSTASFIRANTVTIDAFGNVYVTGKFGDSAAVFGTTTLINSHFVAGNSYDMFVVKYDTNGNFLWAARAGGNNDDEGYSISTDLSGNLFITGGFKSPNIVFGTNTLTNSDNSGNSIDMFAVKYSPTGIVLWAQSEGGNAKDDIAISCTADASGNLFVTGRFYSQTIVFGTTTLTNSGFSNGSPVMFIVKFDASGLVLWAKKGNVNSTSNCTGNSVTTDASGNAYVAGHVAASFITFGAITLSPAHGGYIVKYDPNGSALWARKIGVGAFGNNIAYSIASNISGIYVTGEYGGDTIIAGNDTLTFLNYTDYPLFITKYDFNGNGVYAKSLPSGGGGYGGNTWGNCVATDNFGDIYLGGIFSINPFIIGLDTLTGNPGFYVVYIAKIKGNNTAVSINNEENKEIIKISPNPFSQQTTISFSEEQKHTTIKIMDVIGKEIKTINFTGKQLTIEKGQMNPGIYFIQLTDENKNTTNKKIIIQ